MKLVRILVIAALIVGLVVVALAAGDPQPATPDNSSTAGSGTPNTTSLAADPTAGLADIPENREERTAILAGELKLVVPDGALPVPAVDAAAASRRAAFDAVLAEQDARIQVLADRLATASGGEAELALQKEIEQEKLAASRRLLELQLEFATSDGDQARVEQIQAAITAWDAPAPTYAPVARPAPTINGR